MGKLATYRRTAFGIRLITRLLWRVSIRGIENVPKDGPFILAANHISYLDPPIVGSFVWPRVVHYMAKKELFELFFLSWALPKINAFPVDREGSAKSAMKHALDVLKAGDCVGIFPEGGRNKAGDLEARQGTALLAALAKCPVVPAAIVGSEHANRLAQIKVAYGKPLWLPADRKATKDDLANFTQEMMGAIDALHEDLRGNSQG